MLVAVQKSVDAGLTFRPLPVTARDTLEWDKTRPAEERANRRFGWSREREREVLNAWHAM
jgi:2'-hydroxyisoflavone reductase